MPTLRFSIDERRDIGAVEQDPAARVWRFEAGNDAQRGGLAAARRTQKHDRLAAVDRQVERLDRTRPVRECLGAAFQRDRNGFGAVLDSRHSSSARNFAGRGRDSACMASSSGTIITKNTSV